jgi:anti-anti-sigma factor
MVCASGAIRTRFGMGNALSPRRLAECDARLPDEETNTMATTVRLLEVERQGSTLILTVRQNLRELEFDEIEAEREEMLRQLAADATLANVVADFAGTDYFGSTALGLFVRLWHEVRSRGGRLALCNLSGAEQEILAVAGFGGIWPVYASRQEAVAAVQTEPAAPTTAAGTANEINGPQSHWPPRAADLLSGPR